MGMLHRLGCKSCEVRGFGKGGYGKGQISGRELNGKVCTRLSDTEKGNTLFLQYTGKTELGKCRVYLGKASCYLQNTCAPHFTAKSCFTEPLLCVLFCRVLSGSFDQTVGIWSQDGQLIHRLGPFTSNITALCYVATVGIVWIASGTSQPTLYEPQSGEIVSDFNRVFPSGSMAHLTISTL